MPVLIVLEGVDGSGKSTQADLLISYLRRQDQNVEALHFPRLDQPPYGELIADMLRGELGGSTPVPPKLAALLFALNRSTSRDVLTDDRRRYLVLDRYVYSNMAYQAAREPDPGKREILRQWILDYEFTYLELPKPDLTIFLDVTESFRARNIKPGLQSDPGLIDIYEADLSFQRRSAEEFRQLARTEKAFERIECYNGLDPLSPPEIHAKIISLITRLWPESSWLISL